MGWLEDLDRDAREYVEDAPRKERDLIRRAQELDIDLRPFLVGSWDGSPQMDIARLERAVEATERKRGEKLKPSEDPRDEWFPQLPGADDVIDPTTGLRVPQAEQSGEGSAARLAAAQARGGGDPFGDEQQRLNDPEGQWDEFLLDTGAGDDISNQKWRRTLLYEKPGREYTTVRGGRPAEEGLKIRKGGISARDYIAKVRSMDPDELEGLQRQMYRAGFYGSLRGVADEEPVWGADDGPTVAAVRLLALYTMQYKGKLSITEVLDRYAAKVDTDGDGKPDGADKDKGPKPTIRTTNPLDVQVAAQDTGLQLLGRRLPDQEARGYAGGYNAMEVGSQSAENADQEGAGGGTVSGPPSLGAYADQQIRAKHGAEVDSYTYLQNINTLLQAVGLR